MRSKLLYVTVTLLCVSGVVAEAQTLTAEQAAGHIGETATVCGVVASAHYARRSQSQPTFLSLDKAYPNQVFTVGDFRKRSAQVRQTGK